MISVTAYELPTSASVCKTRVDGLTGHGLTCLLPVNVIFFMSGILMQIIQQIIKEISTGMTFLGRVSAEKMWQVVPGSCLKLINI